MLFQDLRYAWRQLRRAPGFAATIVLTLALSVGVATAVFCVIDTVILRPLPYAQPERIVNIETTSRSGYGQPASWPSFKDERAQARSFAALAGYMDYGTYTVETPSNGPVLLDAVRSTDNFFDVFGVHPLLGRAYLPGEELDGKNDVAVLGYDTWQTYFGGDRNVLNRAVKLDGREFTIIGVMPAGFRYPLRMRDVVYTPHLITQDWMNGRGNHWLRTVGRLKDGVTAKQAEADMTQVLLNLGRAYPGTDEGRTVRVRPLDEAVNEQTKRPLWTLLGAVLAVLAIGCVNIAGLMLARGVQR
ncbi:MAG: ABC transporter permease, partial [Terracidiphilus sp.]